MAVRAGWACDWRRFDREGRYAAAEAAARAERRNLGWVVSERGMPRVAPPSVSGIQGIISSKQRGITVANAFMTDGRVVRFGIVARDPLTVRTLSSEARPGDVEAIEAWFAAQGRGT